MTDRRTNSDTKSDIAWLNAALFDDGGFRPDPAGSFVGLPVKGPIRRLIPGNAGAAAASFQKTHDAMGRSRRLAGRAAQAGLRLGGTRLLRSQALSLDPVLDLGGDAGRSVLARLRQSVPTTRQVAITLGPRRSNRKPVVQLLGADGQTLAYAKVAADDATESMVANEATWLARLGAASNRSSVLAVPELLDRFEWDGRTVAVIAAALPNTHAPDALTTERVEGLALAIVAAGSERTITLAEALGADGQHADDPLSLLAVERLGDRSILVAPWHGDLSPWNTISETDRTWVLDWEFAMEPMAVGADIWHHQVMVSTHLDDMAAAAALAQARSAAKDIGARLAPSSDAEAAFALYLLELIRRSAHATEPDALTVAARNAIETMLTP